MILVNGAERGAIDPRDRGLMYGDGVFRTLAVLRGRPLHWQRHWRKLAEDCAALGIAAPTISDLERDLALVAAGNADAAVKIVVTRGPGERGYRPPATPVPTRIVLASSLPAYPAAWAEEGVQVHLCKTPVTEQPRLAGIKHLNRLDSILARGEWEDPDIAEGLMLDGLGNVVQGTMSNVFAVVDGRLVTPRLDRAGIAGVQRQRILDTAAKAGIAVGVEPLPLERLLSATEVFLTNSLIGLWPVKRLGDRNYAPGTMTRMARDWLGDAA